MPGSLLGIGDERVFNFSKSIEHGFAIGKKRLFFLRVSHFDICANPAALENWPRHRRTDLPHPARPKEEIAGTNRFESCRADDVELGVQVCRGNTDASRGCRALSLS